MCDIKYQMKSVLRNRLRDRCYETFSAYLISNIRVNSQYN